MPILWNISKKSCIAAKFNGEEFSFKPEEKKKVYIPDVVKHLVYKLAPKGLVLVPDDLNDDAELKRLYVAGLRRRRAMLKDVITQYVTANNERKAQQLGTVEPTQYEADCVREIKDIEKEISVQEGISKADSDLVKDYLQENSMSEKQVDESRQRISQDRTGGLQVSDDEEEQAQEAQVKPPKRGKAKAQNAD